MSLPAELTVRKQPKQARSRATYEAIVEATAQVLIRDTYARLTTSAVAQKAGVSVGSLYQYFPNKQALIVAVLEREADTLLAIMTESLALVEGRDLVTVIRTVIGALIRAKAERRDLVRVLETEVPRIAGFEVVQRVTQAAEGLFAALMTQYLPQWPGDVKLTAAVVVSAVDGVVRNAALRGDSGVAEGSAVVGSLDDPVLVDEVVAMVCGYLRLPM